MKYTVTAALLLAASLPAQIQVDDPLAIDVLDSLGDRAGLVYHAAQQQLVAFGGTAHNDTTWLWNGEAWGQVLPTHSPPPTSGGPVYDPANQRVLVRDWTTNDIWSWDGLDWTPVPATGPQPPELFSTSVYDEARAELVTFGDWDFATGDQMWLFDGSSWTEFTGPKPAGRHSTAMVFDRARGEVVLFGGAMSGILFNDTWTWDGASWTQHVVPGPSARSGHTMVYDDARQTVLCYGGLLSGSAATETWEWNGSGWTLIPTANSPGTRKGSTSAYDTARGAWVLRGGERGYRQSSDTWEFDGVDWTRMEADTRPWGRYQPSLAWDGQRLVLFSGSHANYSSIDDMWFWENGEWTRNWQTPRPPARQGCAFCYHEAAGHILLFGGGDWFTTFSDTWLWDGTSWQQGPSGPPAMGYTIAAYDPIRQVVVVHDPGASTWEWDGATWTQASTTGPIPAAWGMAWDSERETIVMSGTRSIPQGGTFIHQPETAEWDGTSWSMVTISGPAYSLARLMHRDEARERITTIGSIDGDAVAYEWHDSLWHVRPIPELRGRPDAVAWHPVERRMYYFGLGRTNDFLRIGSPDPADVSEFGAGCPGTAGTPTMLAGVEQLLWIGEPTFWRVSGIPNGAAATMLFGLSSTDWPGVGSLPFALDTLGAAGCSILVRPDVTLPMFTSGATASIGFQPLAQHLGITLHGQALVLDAAANTLGLTTSNGITGVAGAK